MDLIDKIQAIALRIPKQQEVISTEEATKNAFIMPFISAIGYDVFNPSEVIPEFTADFGTKKGEKVDYAINKDGKTIILMECKWWGADLQKEHASQLYRYFSTTEARFGILTNGIQYQFFSDIDEPNKMDAKPFFEFDMLNIEEHQINELKKFSKQTFALEEILNTASSLKYTRAIKKILDHEFETPSDDFIRFFASKIYDGRLTQQVIEDFSKVIKDACKQFINSKISDRLKSALRSGEESDKTVITDGEDSTSQDSPENKNAIITTEEEIQGYNIVKAIIRQVVDLNRVCMRDTKSYCGILLDNNNRKPICRLYFNSSNKYIGLIVNKEVTKIPIENLNDIFNFSEQLKATIAEYDEILIDNK